MSSPACGAWRRRSVGTLTSVLVVAALVAACDTGSSGTGPSSSAAAPSSAEAPGNPATAVAQPLPDNAVGNAVDQLDGLVESIMDSTQIPGMAVAVVHGGQTVYAKGFGVKEVGTDEAVGTDTVFPLASMSKPIGSTVIASLVTDDVVSWDTPVATNLPGFALSDVWVTDNVTIGDMYAHRSGLPDHAGDKLEDMGYDRQEILARLRYIPLDPFRISYNYTNFGVTAAAESAARKAGADWETLSQNTIYGPLGMENTSSRFADFEEQPDRVVGHVQVDGEWVRTPVQRDPDAQSPAGGVSSSVNDLTHWMTMLLADGEYNGEQVVAEDALLPAVTPEIVSSPAGSPNARAGSYGYGFNVTVTESGRTQYSHSGAFLMGAGTNFLVMPSADVAIVALSNATPVGAVDALTGEFADIVQFGEVRHDWRTLYAGAYTEISEPTGSLVGEQPPENPAPAQPASSHVGTYRNDVYGPAVVRDEDGTLVLAMGPDGVTTHELTHWDGNTYTFTLRNENAALGSVSEVSFDPAAGRMTIEYYDDDSSDGVFTKEG
ncbi:serine hydrolase [Gordonia mangrovi]|uniref:serine hydrolase n=1 Tax=Gordonia mangrovi TaxID=2665643 RepID=UPI0021AC96F8|nr:serine hydrolase [Gordonia mangrovi]UVF76465.1 serine hydrolase [Gordonia mangrovi]